MKIVLIHPKTKGKHEMKKSTNQDGFTLLEVIIGIVIMSILTLTAVFTMGLRGESAQLKSAAADLTSNINLARTRAIRDTRPWAIQFSPGGNSYVLISNSGEVFPAVATWASGNETIFRSVTLPDAVTFGSSELDLDGNVLVDGVTHAGDLVAFNPNGSCSGNGVVYLTIADGKNYAVENLGATGAVRLWNNFGSGWSR